jgi:LysM repeat protein
MSSLLLFGCASDAAERGASASVGDPSSAVSSVYTAGEGADASERDNRPAKAGTLSQRIEDARTEAYVVETLVETPALRVFTFHPTVRQGHLVLTGDVNTLDQYEAAARRAQAVPGVASFDNRLTVAGQAVVPTKATQAEGEEPSPTVAAVVDPSGVYHTVQQGDTLWRIAQQYQASVDRIKTLNSLHGSSLSVGQRIQVR